MLCGLRVAFGGEGAKHVWVVVLNKSGEPLQCLRHVRIEGLSLGVSPADTRPVLRPSSCSAAPSLSCVAAMEVCRGDAGLDVVHEILDSLISQVTAPEDATVGGDPKEEEEKGETRVDPTAILLLSGVSDCLVVSLAYKASRVHVHQPRVARQRHGHFCGHFALHFAHCAQQLGGSSSHGGARRALARAGSRVAQWRRYI